MKHHSDPSSTQFERAKQNSVSFSDALCSILGNLQNWGISESCGDGFSFLINAPWACQVFLVGLRGGSCTLRPVAFGGCLWTLGWEMKHALMNCDIPVYVWQEGGLEAQVWSGMSFLGWREMIFRGILEESLKQISWAAVAKSFQLNYFWAGAAWRLRVYCENCHLHLSRYEKGFVQVGTIIILWTIKPWVLLLRSVLSDSKILLSPQTEHLLLAK